MCERENDFESGRMLYQQKVCLLEFIENHPNLIMSKYRNDKEKKTVKELWEQLSTQLNSFDGPKKSAVQWKRTWVQLKYKCKRRNSKLKVVRNSVAPRPLTSLSRRTIALINRNVVPDPEIIHRIRTVWAKQVNEHNYCINHEADTKINEVKTSKLRPNVKRKLNKSSPSGSSCLKTYVTEEQTNFNSSNININKHVSIDSEEAFMNTHLHSDSADMKDENRTINYQNFEEIIIKEEPLEETSKDCELYENVLQDVKKEEYMTENDEQMNNEYDNLFNINNEIRETENTNSTKITNYQNLEQISIKEELLETTSQDCELYESSITKNEINEENTYNDISTSEKNVHYSENETSEETTVDHCTKRSEDQELNHSINKIYYMGENNAILKDILQERKEANALLRLQIQERKETNLLFKELLNVLRNK